MAVDLYYYDGKHKKADFKDIASYLDKPVWLDITGITKDEADKVREVFDLHPLTEEDLLNTPTRVKVEEFKNYLFCVFYGIEKNEEIEMVELDFILGKNFLITSHRHENDVIESIKKDPERIERNMKKGLDLFFHRILDLEVDNFAPVLEFIDDDIEEIEEEATQNPTSELLTRILQLKRKLVSIKKITLPQREKISFLAKNEYAFISKKSIPYFRDIYDHAIRVSDNIDNYREAIGNAFDAYMSATSNKMNEVMKTLSIIATIMLPLTVISGIYGTNFVKLPGSTYPYGFWVMILGMVIFCILILYYFRRRSWI